MGDEHRGRALRSERIQDGLARLGPQVGVEAGERLVEQHHAQLRCERSREADAALLAAGELVRTPRGVVRAEPDEIERLGRSRPVLRSLRARPKATFSATVRCGNSAPSWAT